MNQMSRTIKALSTLDIYKSCKLELQNLWSRYLEALCTCDPRPRLQWGMRRGAGACVWGCGGGGGAAPPPGSSPWQRPRTATSSASSSRGAASSARQPWSGQLYSYSYILIKVFVPRAQHTLAFCEKASRSSVCRFFHASPSSTLIALGHGEC